MNKKARQVLLQILANSLEQLTGELLVESALPALLDEVRDWQVIAVGKAAASMACGAINCLGSDNIDQLLVITKSGQTRPWLSRLHQAELLESAHPVPDRRSLLAGKRMLESIQQHSGKPVLFLISGGASSLVEVLHPDIQLADLQRVNSWLLASGLPIHTINAIRRRLSLIKGGKLLGYLNHTDGYALLLSDVRNDDPAIIGSGMLCNASSDESLPDILPEWLVSLLPANYVTTSMPFFQNNIIGNLNTMLAMVAELARKTEYPVTVFDDELAGSAETAGKEIADYLCQAEAGIYICGGETTVELPLQPGRGGRNQQLALAAAIELSGSEDIYLLSIGSDGDDGNTDDAGALVDGGTLERGKVAGLDANECLRRADAGNFLAASGDRVTTGPTGTNLRDLVIALKC
jgi:hydroxypyruvate reductase